MLLTFVIVIGLAIVLAVYVYKQITYKEWLKTDDGRLKIALARLQQKPLDVSAMYLAARAYYQKENYQKSFEYYAKIIEITSANMSDYMGLGDRCRVHLEFGIAAYHLKEFDDAMLSLQKARRCIPDTANEELSKVLGKLLFQKQQFSEAAKELESAHRLHRDDSSNNFYLGMCYVKMGQFREALPLLEPLEAEQRENPIFLATLANCYERTGNIEQAVKYYKATVDDSAIGASSASNLAQLYLDGNDTTEALKYLKKVPTMETPPGELSYRSMYDSAKIYGRLGKLEAACVPLQQLYALDPNYRDAGILLHNYREMATNNNLYLLYYGKQQQRAGVMKNLVKQLITGAFRLENEKYETSNIEVVVLYATNRQSKQRYFVWLGLDREVVHLERVRAILNHSKQMECARCLLLTAETFDAEVKSYSEMRSLELIEGAQLRERLLAISP